MRVIQSILMGLLCLCGASVADGAEVALRWTVAEQKAGGHLGVNLWVKIDDAALGCYEVDLQFDPDVLELQGVGGGSAEFFRRAPAADPDAFKGGRVRLVGYQGESLAPFGAEGGIAGLLFEVRRTGVVTASDLGLADARMWDTAGRPISADFSPRYGDEGTFVEGDPTPYVYALGPVFPNPFNASAAIAFSLPEDGLVRLDVYSALGQRIGTLLDKRMSAGVHRMCWDASDLGSGVYLFRLDAAGRIGIRKAVLLR